ncbi:MAG: sensor histidine kinase, partial [Pseudomonadota bacterium]
VMADVEEGLDRISKMVKDLKFVSHRVMDDELEEYDLNQGIQNTIVVAKNEIKYFAEVKEVLGDIPIISAIGGQINQVLLNLIINSAHAIKEKNPEEIGFINIRTYNDKYNVYCEIEDTGCGISEENIDKLFIPFFTTKPAGLGTGLGLPICYDIVVNNHGGNITVESKRGIGTKFTISLPILPIKKDNTEY